MRACNGFQIAALYWGWQFTLIICWQILFSSAESPLRAADRQMAPSIAEWKMTSGPVSIFWNYSDLSCWCVLSLQKPGFDWTAPLCWASNYCSVRVSGQGREAALVRDRTLHLLSYMTQLSVACLMVSTFYIRKTSIYLKCHMIIIMLSHQIGWKTMYLYGKSENLKHWFYFYTFYFSC